MFSRVVNLILLTALVIAIPLSHVALSKKKAAQKKKAPPKVEICHFPEDGDGGRVIRVSSRAVDAHVAKHGDCRTFVVYDTGGCTCFVIGPGN